ncbi:hypothetical protein KO525_00910 [Psychrosphaera sp. B3R10]|uniref:hypothetical protein n=1 Tax=unclassified Psychrosphaera TaxID=2641570 RepID=UPI001C085EC9|nr:MULTISPECIES: hypothetical protein [unclassified Psychrosphaera]MBU2883751.1 hypothetical protein [Psychrosphaera sp. I2R16]MBU2987947.1 hypothetical protein [Psychrosphaera sp. B3R10]MDO6720406.1 hypothetical protein [Psychrosphaera sp. 1_MG-2023]
MNLKRLLVSSLIAFTFYASWAYWANLSPTIALNDTIRSALVQGLYSGLVTLVFTFILENIAAKFHSHILSLSLVTPFICSLHKLTKRNKVVFGSFHHGLQSLAVMTTKPRRLIWVTPIVPIMLQSVLVISVNVVNQTPNLWLTVAPSILFSAIYAYAYLISFLTKSPAEK